MRLEASTHHIIEGQYLRDILDQPRALAATLEGLHIPKGLRSLAEGLREGRLKRVVLTGMGASFHALHPLFLGLNAGGYTAVMAETSELVHALGMWLEPQSLLIAVSQSGESAEIVRLLEETKHRAPIIGITNTAGSALATRADVSLLTFAGKEVSVSCKTYVTALVALYMLGELLTGSDETRTRATLTQVQPAVASYLETWKDHVEEIAGGVRGTRNLFLLGRGESLAAVGDGALIVKESVRCPAEGMSGPSFRHGPLEMVNGETFAIVFAGPEPTRALQFRLAEDIRRAGGRTAWVADDAPSGAWRIPAVPAGLRPVLEILPVQMTTLALAAEAGIEAGRFSRIQKITTIE